MASSDSSTHAIPQLTNNTPDQPSSHHLSEIPHYEEHQPLEHKLLVQSSDGKITNLLCPIELVLEAQNYSAPLIPVRYNPNCFCLFQNVSSNSYKATTPRTSRSRSKSSKSFKNAKNSKTGSKSTSKVGSKSGSKSRKRKSDQLLTRIPKKRKVQKPASSKKSKKGSSLKIPKIPKYLSESPKSPLDNLDEIDDEMEDSPTALTADLFQYDPTLSVHNRPKRQRKKVSYIEPDPNVIPIHYIQPKGGVRPSALKTAINTVANAETVKPQAQMDRFVEMRWVQCDKCLKWRRIPTSVSDAELTGEWECSMNKWDLKRNSCTAPEEAYDLAEETTVEVTNGAGDQQNEKREKFYAELATFYQSKGMLWKRLDIEKMEQAQIGGKNIDFLQLYLEITRRGGYTRCVANRLWEQVYPCLQCYQVEYAKEASQRLQNLYAKYLNDYEQKQRQQSQAS